jgi:hypothetical protein
MIFLEPNRPPRVIARLGILALQMSPDETSQEKRERYLRHALEAEDLALTTHDREIAASFRSIARAWEKLAEQIPKGRD